MPSRLPTIKNNSIPSPLDFNGILFMQYLFATSFDKLCYSTQIIQSGLRFKTNHAESKKQVSHVGIFSDRCQLSQQQLPQVKEMRCIKVLCGTHDGQGKGGPLQQQCRKDKPKPSGKTKTSGKLTLDLHHNQHLFSDNDLMDEIQYKRHAQTTDTWISGKR